MPPRRSRGQPATTSQRVAPYPSRARGRSTRSTTAANRSSATLNLLPDPNLPSVEDISIPAVSSVAELSLDQFVALVGEVVSRHQQQPGNVEAPPPTQLLPPPSISSVTTGTTSGTAPPPTSHSPRGRARHTYTIYGFMLVHSVVRYTRVVTLWVCMCVYIYYLHVQAYAVSLMYAFSSDVLVFHGAAYIYVRSSHVMW